jgi:predicted metal-dependent enzyme (double-stranded beta helix superfamily)
MTMTEADPRVEARLPVPPSLKRFIWDIQSMVELADSEREILLIGRDLMRRLIGSDDCLPAVFAAPDLACGRQFQLYVDGLERFTVVSTVLAAGAALSITQPGVWEIAGVLHGDVMRGAERLAQGAATSYASAGGGLVRLGNALNDRPSIAIQVYGGEIGKLDRRSIAPNGAVDEQPSRYANPEHAPPYDIFSIQTEIRD